MCIRSRRYLYLFNGYKLCLPKILCCEELSLTNPNVKLCPSLRCNCNYKINIVVLYFSDS